MLVFRASPGADIVRGEAGQHGRRTASLAFLPGDQFVVRQTDRMHQCAFQASAAANNITLLSHSIVRLSEQPSMPSEASEEIGKAASTALTLCASVAVSTARIAVWATQIQRYPWLQQGYTGVCKESPS